MKKQNKQYWVASENFDYEIIHATKAQLDEHPCYRRIMLHGPHRTRAEINKVLRGLIASDRESLWEELHRELEQSSKEIKSRFPE